MAIAQADYDSEAQLDAATLPPFSNYSRCPACNQNRARVCYAPGSAVIRLTRLRGR